MPPYPRGLRHLVPPSHAPKRFLAMDAVSSACSVRSKVVVSAGSVAGCADAAAGSADAANSKSTTSIDWWHFEAHAVLLLLPVARM